ncbi:MAG TPA: type II secretion system protein GspL [Steroidobacteraceae bacterium]|nr:type II secretion system protein GspL [Steroidobacteraceae bacterium]
MAQWLLIRLAREPERDPTWMVADEAGRVVLPPQTAPLSGAATHAAGRRVCVLIPAADVLVTEVDVPVKSGTKLQQVVPFALEEQLAEDIDGLHFAIGRRIAESNRVPVAVVSRALLESWLETLRSARLAPECIYADSELLPANPGQAVALLEGDDVVLRLPGSAAAAMPIAALDTALDIAAQPDVADAEGAARGLVLYTTPAEWQQHKSVIEAERQRFEGIKVQLLPSGALTLFAQQLPSASAINLLQGPYAPASELATGWRAWRVAAILAVSLLGLHVVGKAVELGALRRAERTLDESIETTFRAAMPAEQSTVDARRRMNQRLLAVRGGDDGSGLLAALGALAQARANVPGSTVQAMSYRDGALELRMSAPDAETLDRLSQALRSSGWQADLTSGGAAEGRYEGRLQLRGRGTA